MSSCHCVVQRHCRRTDSIVPDSLYHWGISHRPQSDIKVLSGSYVDRSKLHHVPRGSGFYDMVVSQIRGPYYRPSNNIIRIIGPPKMVPPKA